jgi:hypothetical protein
MLAVKAKQRLMFAQYATTRAANAITFHSVREKVTAARSVEV